MATLTYGENVAKSRATPPVIYAQGSGLYRIPWSYTVGEATAYTSGGTIALVTTDVVHICKLPAGCKVILPLSYMKVSADTGGTSSIDVGWTAYKDKNNATIAADPDGMINGFLSGNILNYALNDATQTPYGAGTPAVSANGVLDFTDAMEEITVTLTCLDSGGTFDGDVADVWSGWFIVEYGGN